MSETGVDVNAPVARGSDIPLAPEDIDEMDDEGEWP